MINNIWKEKYMTPKKIALLTDSCADLAKEELERAHIFTVPLRICCADGEYADGVDIQPEDVYRRLHAGEMPKTSLPAGADIHDVFARIIDEGYDGVIAIMLSSGLSGTFNTVRLMAEDFSDRLTAKVFDSCSGSLGQGMTLLQLAEDIENGMGWDELVERRAPALLAGSTVYFSVDTLEYLKRGGRIGKVTAAAGTLLKLKPILTFAPDGQLQSAAKVRGGSKVPDKLVELVQAACGAHKRYNLAVVNGGAPEGMETVREKLMAALPGCDHIWDGRIDSTLSVYVGDGVLGVAVQVLD